MHTACILFLSVSPNTATVGEALEPGSLIDTWHHQLNFLGLVSWLIEWGQCSYFLWPQGR